MLKRIENYDLSAHNTFGLKVSCALYIDYDAATDLLELVPESLPQPVKHIGAGSNLVFTGPRFEGTILHSSINYIKYIDMGLDEVFMAVGAGVEFDHFVHEACKAGYWGAENLSLIPGEVGAAAVQNIGAYGVEVKDIISGVVCYDTIDRKKVSFKAGECAYGYRTSRFKSVDAGRYIITAVLFKLTRKYSPKLDYGGVRAAFCGIPPQTPMEVREKIIEIRNSKLPDPKVLGSAGSYFKNPVLSREQYSALLGRVNAAQEGAAVSGEISTGNPGAETAPEPPHFDLPDGKVKVPAAWLIDSCGLKGTRIGGAAVYENQPLVIVNASGEASGEDIIALEQHIIDTVRCRWGVVLEPEAEHII